MDTQFLVSNENARKRMGRKCSYLGCKAAAADMSVAWHAKGVEQDVGTILPYLTGAMENLEQDEQVNDAYDVMPLRVSRWMPETGRAIYRHNEKRRATK